MYYCKKRLEKYYGNQDFYETDRKLRLLNLEILEIIELDFKKKMIFLFKNYDNLLNQNFYQEKFLEKTLNFINEKTEYFRLHDRNIKEEISNKGNICIKTFIDKLTFGEIVKIFKHLKIKNKKIISRKYNLLYIYFENFIEIAKYIRNICSHQENLFNINGTYKIIIKEVKNYFNTNSSYLSYFFVLSIFENIILNENKWQEKIFLYIKGNIGIEKCNLGKKINIFNIKRIDEKVWNIWIKETLGNLLL